MLSRGQLHCWRRFLLFTGCLLMLLVSGCTLHSVEQPGATPTLTPARSTPVVEQIQAFASVIVGEADQRQLSRVVVIPGHAILPAGETVALAAVAYDKQGNALPPDELEARWRMLDLQAGTITRTGIFHAGLQRGVFNQAIEVTVTQEIGGRMVDLQALASVSVIRPLSEQDISRVQALPSELQVERETQSVLSALAMDRDGVPVPGVQFSWEMLTPSAGAIDAEGRFTSGKELGTFPAAIRVIAQKKEDPTQNATATISVMVVDLAPSAWPSKVNLYPQAVSLRPGDTIQFRALALDQRGNLFRDVEPVWTLRDPSAGELDSQGFFRAGQTPGTYPNLVEITLTSTGGGTPLTLKATATVTVLQPTKNLQGLQRLLLTPETVRLRPGESIRLAARALARSGQAVPSATLRWSASNNAVQVSPNGVVTAVGAPGNYAGVVSVEATQVEEGREVKLTASASVVIIGPLSRVEVVPRQVAVAPRQVVQFTYLAYDINGTRIFDVSPFWEVLDSRAGVIDATGLFIASKTSGEYKDVIRVTVKLLQHKAGGT